MYKQILKIIEKGNFELSDMLRKIEKLWIQGQITDYEKERLEEQARDKADPQRSMIPLQEQVMELSRMVMDLTKRIQVLERAVKPEEVSDEEWVPYQRPNSPLGFYQKGSKILFRNKKYIGQMDDIVWNPLDYPKAWKEFEEDES